VPRACERGATAARKTSEGAAGPPPGQVESRPRGQGGFRTFGVGSFVAIALGLRRHWLAPYAALTVGAGQMVWITVQCALMWERGVFFLQPLMFGCGALIALSAFFWWRGTRRGVPRRRADDEKAYGDL
jgi:hypothetical protein